MDNVFRSLLIASSLILASCGEYDDEYYQQPEEEREERGTFETRLNDNLLIAGEECVVNQSILVGGRNYICEEDNMLITLDDVNTCSFGRCGSRVEPFLGTIDPAFSDSSFDYFDINPMTPLSRPRIGTLNSVFVRRDRNGVMDVVFRDDII